MIRKIFIIISIWLMVFLIFFTGAEIYFRIFDPQVINFLRPDPVLGFNHISNLSMSQNDSCIKANFYFNNEGMGDIDHTIEKPENVFRIAVIGDSYVEAMQMNLEDAYFKQLEKELNSQGKNIEVLSFGVGGFGTAQELLLLRNYALKYSPDLIILSFFSANDIGNNSFALEKSPNIPYARIDKYGDIKFDDFEIPEAYLKTFYSSWRTNLFDNFHTVRFLYRLSNKSILFRNFLAKLNFQTKTKETKDSTDSNAIYLKNQPAEWQDAWKTTEALIMQMKKDSEQSGAKFLLFSLSNPEQISDDLFGGVISEHPGQEVIQDNPEQILFNFSKENNINYLPALPIMKELSRTGVIVHPACHGHWSVEASRLAGKMLADFLIKNNLIN